MTAASWDSAALHDMLSDTIRQQSAIRRIIDGMQDLKYSAARIFLVTETNRSVDTGNSREKCCCSCNRPRSQ